MLMRRRASVESAELLRPYGHAICFGKGPTDLYTIASEAFADGVRWSPGADPRDRAAARFHSECFAAA